MPRRRPFTASERVQAAADYEYDRLREEGYRSTAQKLMVEGMEDKAKHERAGNEGMG
jgi:hypothetical protein